MEFVAEHPLGVLQLLTALVSFAAGFTTYHFGWRRAQRSNQSGSGGQHGLLTKLRRHLRPRGHRPMQFPHFIEALVANEDAWRGDGPETLPDRLLA